jgi:two-component system, sensor histidine kinase and response regulator
MSDIINKEELLEEIDGDWEFLEESVDMLNEDAPELLSEIKKGMDAKNTETIWQSAHALKSMVGNFAAKRSFDAAYQVESLGRNGDDSGMTDAVSHLESEVELLKTALKELLKNK